MNEREPTSSLSATERVLGYSAPIIEALGAQGERIHNPDYGEGMQISFGFDNSARLDLYPSPDKAAAYAFTAAHLATRNAHLMIFHIRAQVRRELVVFSSVAENEGLQLTLTQETVTLKIQPALQAAEPPSEPASASERTDPQLDEETALLGPSTGARDDADEPAAQGNKAEDIRDGEKQPRVTILGRLGRDPRFRETRNGTIVATFPVGVPMDDGTTSWHRAVVFNERAEKIREQLKRGDRVEIVGYVHQRRRHRHDGSPSTIEELYAAVVKLR